MSFDETGERKHRRRDVTVSVGRALCVVGMIAAVALMSAPDGRSSEPALWGGAGDAREARAIWAALANAGLIGPTRTMVSPTKGEDPHGVVQQIGEGRAVVDGAARLAIVKANHRGDDVSIPAVAAEPNRFLTGYAVMVKRAPGYDPAHRDWFWAVFNPDGTVREWQGRAIAGRVDTGNTDGCIGCHVKKGGADLRTLTKE